MLNYEFHKVGRNIIVEYAHLPVDIDGAGRAILVANWPTLRFRTIEEARGWVAVQSPETEVRLEQMAKDYWGA